MIKALYVPKSYGTYSDTCLMLGLACLAEYALGATGQKQGMQLIDEGTCYRIQFNKPMDLSKIESVSYVDLFPVIVWAENDTPNIPEEAKEVTSIFSAEENIKISRLYSSWRRINKNKWSEDAPEPPDARTQISSMIMSLNSTKNYLNLWQEAWNNREKFGCLLAIILNNFSKKDILLPALINEQIIEEFKQQTNVKLSEKINVVQIFRPTAVDGSSSTKSNSIAS